MLLGSLRSPLVLGPGKLKFVEEFGEEALTDIHRVYEDKINMCLTDSRTFCVVHAFNPRNFDDERRQVLETCKEMFKSGLVLGTDGNISMRIGDDHIAIKGSGLPYETLGVEGIVVCDLEGKAISGEVYKPSSEINLHLGLYKSRSDFTSIVHCHSKSSSAVACTRKPLPCFHYSIGELTEGMEIPCAEYATYGTEVLADNVVKAMGNTSVGCLMSNHGSGERTANRLAEAREIIRDVMEDGAQSETDDEISQYYSYAIIIELTLILI